MNQKIESFSRHFTDFKEQYVLIGGAACFAWFADHEPAFRATEDLDIVLILENLSLPFIERLLLYLEENGYQQWEQHFLNPDAESRKVMYRFMAPAHSHAPKQIELLSRRGELATLSPRCTLAPVKAMGEYTGLSCIVLDDAYYHFLRTEIRHRNECSLLSVPALMMLKMKAYLNLQSAYSAGEAHGSDRSSANIRKHRNDVFFMLLSLTADERCPLPPELQNDFNMFVSLHQPESDQWQSIMNHLKSKYGSRILKQFSPKELLQLLEQVYSASLL